MVTTVARDGKDDNLVRIRPALPEDAAAFLALKSEAGNVYWSGHESAMTRDRFCAWYNSVPEHRTIYFTDSGEALAGYLYIDHPVDGAGAIELSVGVAEANRGQGLATQMIQAAISLEPNHDLEAWIFTDNTASIRAFEKAGFYRDQSAPTRNIRRADAPDGIPQGLWRYSLTKTPTAAFTYADLQTVDDWRARLVWPVDIGALREQGGLAIRTAIAHISSCDDAFVRQVLVVALGTIINRFQVLSEAALAIDACAGKGWTLSGGLPDAPSLMRDGDSATPVEGWIHDNKTIKTPRHRILREIARTASFTPWRRLPAALLAVDGQVASHNKFLIQEIRRAGKSARSVHAVSHLAAQRRKSTTKNTSEPGAKVSTSVEVLLKALTDIVPNLSATRRERLYDVLRQKLLIEIGRIETDVTEIRVNQKLPSVLWCGTNGAYPTRLLASEIVRRGGVVNGFDHGGVTGITQLAELTAIVELLTTTSFTVATPEWKALVETSGALDIARPLNRPEIRAGDGEPTFKAAIRNTPPSSSGKLRVIYVGHPFRGVRQFAIPAIPDSVYWDFQERLIGSLSALPIELICKPHPEGVFKGGRTPIENLAKTSYRPFEEHLDDADVFLFDAPTSTTFMESLCTRRRVVLLDRGHYPFSKTVEPHARERCRIVQIRTNGEGRLHVDNDALSDALISPGPDPDPSYFRRLLTGSTE